MGMVRSTDTLREGGDMTTNQPPSPSDDTPPDTQEAATGPSDGADDSSFTRTSATWVAVGASLLLLILLIVFMLQNSTKVEVQFLGAVGTIPLGLAMLIAAVTGGVVVAIAGAARITQLRRNVRRNGRGS